MKWVFLLGLIFGTPALAGFLRSNQRYVLATCFVLGASIFILGPRLWTAAIGWPAWPGSVRGIELSFIDAISIALIASTKSVRFPRSVIFSFAIYCLALLISTPIAYQTLPALFYVWQLLRAVLLFVAVARVCATLSEAPVALVSGLGMGLMFEAAYVIYQFATGDPRPGGSLGHPNLAGLSLDFVVFPTVAIMLSATRSLSRGAPLVAALVIAVLGASRATMGLLAIGVLLTIVLSMAHRNTSRKSAFGGLLAVVLLVSAPAMLWASNRRTEAAKVSSDHERAAMKEAAGMIIADHPFGVGANQYVVVTNTGGYSQRAGVAWNEHNRAAAVHNTYYLVAAEMGILGLFGLVAVLVSLIALGFRSLRHHLPGKNGELVPGLLTTMIVVTVHISYEFVFMDRVIHYLFAISAGMLCALAAQAKSVQKSNARRQISSPELSHAS